MAKIISISHVSRSSFLPPLSTVLPSLVYFSFSSHSPYVVLKSVCIRLLWIFLGGKKKPFGEKKKLGISEVKYLVAFCPISRFMRLLEQEQRLLLNHKVCSMRALQTHQQSDRHQNRLITELGGRLGHTSSSKPLPRILRPRTPAIAIPPGIPRSWLPVRSHYYDLTFSAECSLLGFL